MLQNLDITSPPALQRMTVMQGQALVSADPAVELSTVLGSCVAMCLYDPIVGLGGMNHFLLAEPPESRRASGFDEHYGVYLMEVLINAMLAKGAAKSRLKAHLYGGANINRRLGQIGTANGAFARQFLTQEGIPLVRADLGGECARRVDMRASRGLVRCRTVEAAQVHETRPAPRPSANDGDVELF